MNRIKELREAAGMTQAELAKRVGVSTTTVRNWELEYNYPSTYGMCKLADVFNTSIGYVWGMI
ncbi:helix-turn-helix transcriptional regulator [Oscillospiraceae bacterium 50-58]|jgi:transcriptional regulator with XRE-family HTH domain|nr:helix-turn-helix transcriptional regulator [Oscillospiraceae bacterium]